MKLNKKYIALNNLIILQRGFDLPEIERVIGNIPVVASTGIIGSHNIAKVKGPGVVIGRSGSIGGGQYVAGDFWPLNTTLWVKDFKEHNPRFIYYVLKNIDFSRFNFGTGVPTLNRNHIANIKVLAFDKSQEEKIADILSKYDDLIENNRRRIDLLERSARLLYKEWFVRLRFPGHEHTPIIDGIPEGWEKVKLQSIIKIFHGFAFRSEQFVEQKTNTIVVRMGNFKEEGGLKFEEKDNKYLIENSYNEKYLLKPRDLLMVLSDVTRDGRIIGNVGFVPNDNNLYVLNQRVARIEAPEDLKLYLYCSFGSSLYKNHCLSRANSVTVLNLKNDHIYEYQILIPDHQRLLIFSGIVKSIVNNIHVLEQQNQKLKQARDILLPKLMNGEIEV